MSNDADDLLKRVGGAILLAEVEWTPKSSVSKERALALAAIAAMREPTREMTEDGFHQLMAFDEGYDSGMFTVKDIWQNMIDVALKP